MSAAPDVIRMLTLVPWLLRRPGITIRETATAFRTEERNIRAELEHLDFCGLPGLGGGALFDVTVVDDAIWIAMADELTRPMRPTPIESLRLLLIATAAERVIGGDVPALSSAIVKLAAALGVDEGAVDVLESGPDDAVLAARRAITEDRCVRFSYRGRMDAAPLERHVEPWRLDLREGAWYLHGYDRTARAPRIFRLDRSSGPVALDGPRSMPVPEELPEPHYEPGPEDVEVELHLAPQAAWLLDALEPDATLEAAGSLTVTMRTGAPEWLARLILMCGGSAEVVRPTEIRQLVRSRAEQALLLLAATD
jgi:predicted DNA-binding transcriptional regulator YafY